MTSHRAIQMISNHLISMKKLLIISLLIPFLSLSAQTNRAESAAKTTEGDLSRALAELSQLRNNIAAAKVPLAKKINSLENTADS